MAHGREEFGLHARQVLQLLVALGQVGHHRGPRRLGRRGRGAAVLEVVDDATDKGAKGDEHQRGEERLAGIGGVGVGERHRDDVRNREGGADGEFDGRVVQGEEEQGKQQEGKGVQDARAELGLEHKGDRQAADG